jgi:hypothetical protein
MKKRKTIARSKSSKTKPISRVGSRRLKSTARKKPAAKRRDYSVQMAKLTGREVSAQERLDRLTERYVRDGMDETAARDRARAEMRDNNKRDWRRG